jgi:hypothetical protein
MLVPKYLLGQWPTDNVFPQISFCDPEEGYEI